MTILNAVGTNLRDWLSLGKHVFFAPLFVEAGLLKTVLDGLPIWTDDDIKKLRRSLVYSLSFVTPDIQLKWFRDFIEVEAFNDLLLLIQTVVPQFHTVQKLVKECPENSLFNRHALG